MGKVKLSKEQLEALNAKSLEEIKKQVREQREAHTGKKYGQR